MDESLPLKEPVTLLGEEEELKPSKGQIFHCCRSKTSINLIVISLISFSQGISGLPDLAINYLYKDKFHFTPAQMQSIKSLTMLPWNFKILYGFISDFFPLFGDKRKPYLILMSSLNFLFLWLLGFFHDNLYFFITLIVLLQISSAFCNVIGEALVVETSRLHFKNGKNKTAINVFIFFFIKSLGYLLTSFCSGALLEFFSPKTIFIITSFFSLLIFLSALLLRKDKKINNNFTDEELIEERLSLLQRKKGFMPLAKQRENNDTFAHKMSLLFQMLKNKKVLFIALFLFYYSLTPGYSIILFYFYTNELKFTPVQIGNIYLVDSLAILLGMVIFTFFLKKLTFRKVMLTAICIDLVFNANIFVLFKGYYKFFHIPDLIYALFVELSTSTTSEIMTMPILVLVCNICPQGVEGTLYAFFMGLMNIGYFIAAQYGALVANLMNITSSNFKNILYYIIMGEVFLVIQCFVCLFINEKEYKVPITIKSVFMKRSLSFSKLKTEKIDEKLLSNEDKAESSETK